jgi:flagellar hook-length control protein FliK
MQIELVSAAPGAAPAPDSTGADSAAAPGSFAELLNGVSDDATDPAPADGDDSEDDPGDAWMAVVPFILALPVQGAIERQLPELTDGEVAQEEGTAIDAANGASAPVTLAADVTEATAKALNATDSAGFVADVGAVNGLTEQVLASPAGASHGPASEVATAASTASNDAGTADWVKELGKDAAETSAIVGPDVPSGPTTDSVVEPISNPDAGAASPAAALERAADGSAAHRSETDIAVEPAPKHKGVASRLARALERALETPAAHRGETESAEGSRPFDGGSEGQSSFGDTVREQLPQAANSNAQSPSTPAFSVVAAAQHVPRVSGALGSPETSLMPGGPNVPREHDVALQIVQSLRLQFRDGIGEAILRLKPEHLGSVAISLRIEDGGLKANVQAELPAVRQWLESQQDTLRSALAEHGLRLDRFDVDPDGQQQAAPDDHAERSPRKRQPRRSPQGDQPVFEVVV